MHCLVHYLHIASAQSFYDKDKTIPALEMNIVDIVTALDSQYQLLKKTEGLNEDCTNCEKKVNQLEAHGLIVLFNFVSECDAKEVALYKCQKSSLFIE